MPEIRKWREPVRSASSNTSLPWRLSNETVYAYDPKKDRTYTIERSKFWEMCRDDVAAAYERDRLVFTSQPVNGHWGPTNLSVSGEPTYLPTTRHDFKEIKSNNSGAWKESQKPGSIVIVVSPFQRGFYTVSQGMGSSDRRTTPETLYGNTLGGLVGSSGSYVSYKGHVIRNSQLFVANSRWVTAKMDTTPADRGFRFDLLHDFMERLPDKLPTHADVITECLADANTGMVDLLTSAAEMPQLIASLFQGCKTILRLFKDAKKRELRLYDKVAKLRAQQAKLAGIDKPTRDHLNQIRQVEKTIKDLLDAVTDVWLTYRLNIYPTAKTIEDTIKASDMLESKFIRFRELKVVDLDPPKIPGWEVSGKLQYEFRCFIKRGAQRADMFDVLFSSNPWLTAWELVPLSFVVDRYMSIGNLLASLAPRNPKVSDGTTISWKVSGAFSYVHPDSGATVTVKPSLYKRNVINPNSFVCLTFPEERSFHQQLDHLALSWGIFLRNFSRV